MEKGNNYELSISNIVCVLKKETYDKKVNEEIDLNKMTMEELIEYNNTLENNIKNDSKKKELLKQIKNKEIELNKNNRHWFIKFIIKFSELSFKFFIFIGKSMGKYFKEKSEKESKKQYNKGS